MEYRILNNTKYGKLSAISKIRNQFFSVSDIQNSKLKIQNSAQSGIATLPAVMVFGIMALVVAISVTTLSFTELFISQGSGQSSRAHFYAESGARDALIKIARDKNYVYETGEGYEIEFSSNGCTLLNDCAKVLVTGSDTSKVVTSKGIMKSSTRTLQANVVLDTNGLITTVTWNELTN